MLEFCGSPLWVLYTHSSLTQRKSNYKLLLKKLQDSDKTWHTEDPFFTQCFELTILVWVPCVLFFVFAPLDIYYIKSSKYANIPWGFVNIVRLTIPTLLICLCIADLSMAAVLREEFNLHNVHTVTPVIKLITFVSYGRQFFQR